MSGVRICGRIFDNRLTGLVIDRHRKQNQISITTAVGRKMSRYQLLLSPFPFPE